MPRLPAGIAALITVISLSLSGCTLGKLGADDAHAAPKVEVTEISLPEGAQLTEQRALSVSTVPAAAGQQALVGVRTVEPAGSGALTVSRIDSSGSLPPIDLGIDIPGDVQTQNMAASAELTAIAVTTRVEERNQPHLLTSDDRKEWTEIALPEQAIGNYLTQITVVGKTVYGAYTDADGATHVLTVQDGEASTSALAHEPGTRMYLNQIAAQGTRVVLLGGLTRPDQKYTDTVWVSTDKGKNFAEPVEIVTEGSLSGISATSDGWLITGTEPNAGHKARPTSWHSKDGTKWLQEDTTWAIEHNPGFELWEETDDASVSAPAIAPDGKAVVWVTAGSNLGVLYTRSATGRWQAPLHHPSPQDFPGTDPAVAMAINPSGTINVVTIVNSSASLSQVDEFGWQQRATITEPQFPLNVMRIRTDGPGVALELQRRVFESNSEGWRSYSEVLRHDVTGSTVSEASNPFGLRLGVEAVDVASGTTAAVGWGEDGESKVLVATGKEERWDAEPNLDDIGSIGVVKFLPGAGFVMLLSEKESSKARAQATIVSSSDGVKWHRAAAKALGNTGPAGSSALDVCELPNGAALVVGESGDQPASWLLDGTEWKRVTTQGPAHSWLMGCVRDEESLLVFMETSTLR